MIKRENRPKPAATEGARRRAAFTLPEVMVVSALFGIMVAGTVYCQMFGMRQDEWVNSKIGATEMARLSFNDLANDIRAAKIWQVGNGDLNSFTGFPLGANQRGNALKLSMTTDTNQYYLYFFDTNALKLYRGHSGATTRTCLAQSLTNTMYFQAQNYRGDNQTDLTHKGVIDVVMQFCQYQYPITKIGPGCLYDYYKMELRLTPHTPDGP
jgi:prepilin-type N-terminal cleavage/methylation domain-containing protein